MYVFPMLIMHLGEYFEEICVILSKFGLIYIFSLVLDIPRTGKSVACVLEEVRAQQWSIAEGNAKEEKNRPTFIYILHLLRSSRVIRRGVQRATMITEGGRGGGERRNGGRRSRKIRRKTYMSTG